MAKNRQQKESDLQELTEKLKNAKSIVFTEYRGTSVKDIDKFRRSMEKENVFTKVYKISLIKKALEANGINADTVNYKTPVVLSVSSEDEATPARIVKTVGKDVKTISMLAGVVDGQMLSLAQVTALADLPSKDQLRGALVGVLNSPVSGMVNVLAGNVRGLITVLNAKAQQA